MKESITILTMYWGYPSFRPPQDKIIASILNKKDTLALLPTGGGKSICFQVPALQLPGVCIVISPLIALMKDQVQNLKKRGIKAEALFSGMTYREVETTIENCKHGGIKLLYLSPERLQSEDLQARLQHVPISFIAVDEAHCISQWGYDFRPPYLKIAEFREQHPDVPVMALTATATPNVANDIMEKLSFETPHKISKSFYRENLAYRVHFTDDKWGKLLSLFQRATGSGIVYTRSRKLTKLIAAFLERNQISADFYHAGLSANVRDTKQQEWQMGKTKVIVATNAFGMGIDKPDVRLVAHLHLPDNLESYFQEAGRAGRDGKPADAVTLVQAADIDQLKKRADMAFPPKSFLKRVYTALGNYFQLAVGSGEGEAFDFDLQAFSKRYEMHPWEVHSALKIMEKQEYLSVSDPFETYSKVQFKVSYEELYRFQLSQEKIEPLIKLLLRNHAGMFDHLVTIREDRLSSSLSTSVDNVKKVLRYLHSIKLIHYQEAKEKPQLVYLKERIPTENLSFTKEVYDDRKRDHMERVTSMINFIENDRICRSRQLLAYFGEQQDQNCGRCDVCLQKKATKNVTTYEHDLVKATLDQLLAKEPEVSYQQLVTATREIDPKKTKKLLEWMIQNGEVTLTVTQKIKRLNS